MSRQLLATASLLNGPGCYVVRDGERVLYVGMALNISTRWNIHEPKRGQHHRKYFFDKYYPGATIECVPCDRNELRNKERSLIKELKPVMNNRPLYHVMNLLGIKNQERYET